MARVLDGYGAGTGPGPVPGVREETGLEPESGSGQGLGWRLGWVVRAGTGPELNLGEGRNQAGTGALVRACPEPETGLLQGRGHGLDRGMNPGEGRNLSLGHDGAGAGDLS